MPDRPSPLLLASLGSHPAFEYLIAHLVNARAQYDKQLATPASPSEAVTLDSILAEKVRRARLEEAVYWIGWLERQVRRAGIAITLKAPNQEEDFDGSPRS